MDQVTAVNESPCHDAVHDESCCNKRVKPARAADAEFACVNGDVVCYGTIGETDKDEIGELRNGACEEETVQRKRGTLFLFAGLHFERLHKHKPDNAKCCGNRENDSVAESFVKKHAGHGTGGEG